MNLYSDPAFLFLLPVERVLNNPDEIKRFSQEGWQLFLAEARKRFLVDELIWKNNLSTENLAGEVLEIDGGVSKLGLVLARNGLRLQQQDLYNYSHNTQGKFALGVIHNQLEHYPSLSFVNSALSFMAERSAYGMVHQVHAVDDPLFNLDSTHHLRMTSSEWEDYFKEWASNHQEEGWEYLGSHRGSPGRPKNFVIERNGSLPFYAHYEQQTIRKITAELTAANGISAARIPLLLLSLSLAKNNPYMLSAMVGVVHALDAADGYAARKGFGNSPFGPTVDVLSDHLVEAITMFDYAYQKGLIPKEVPWLLASRNISTNFLRFYNAFKVGVENSHPHETFGTTGDAGRRFRLLYGLTKALGDMVIPIAPRLGLTVSVAHIAASVTRAIPVWTSPTSQQIYKEILSSITNKKR